MSPSYQTREQYERWHVRRCGRCGRTAGLSANWEGPICRTCYDRAVHTRGRCPVCDVDRLLPGRQPDGQAICRDCAGITRDFICAGCGTEAALLGRRRCERCTLADKLAFVLDDGTGQIRKEMLPVHNGLKAVEDTQVKNTLSWLAQPQIIALLTNLSRGVIPISHEALASESNWRTTTSLRELLMHHGVLPGMDKQLMLFQRWLTDRLANLDNAEHLRVIERFATWSELRRHRAAAGHGPLSSSSINYSRQSINRAIDFLTWLDEHNTTLGAVTQAAVDHWFTDHYATRRPGQAFARWAMENGSMPRRILPIRPTNKPSPLPQHRRLALIAKLLDKTDIPLSERVVGLFVLLHAQPLSRIVTLTITDIVVQDEHVTVRFGELPVPAPEPVAGLLRALLAQRKEFRGPNFDTQWLFPGRRPSQPIVARHLGDKLREHGVPVQAGRTATLQQLVLQAPAPVIASMLGYHHGHTTRLVREGGGTWNRYAPGDHDQ